MEQTIDTRNDDAEIQLFSLNHKATILNYA